MFEQPVQQGHSVQGAMESFGCDVFCDFRNCSNLALVKLNYL